MHLNKTKNLHHTADLQLNQMWKIIYLSAMKEKKLVCSDLEKKFAHFEKTPQQS